MASIIRAGVMTTFVCLAEDPEALAHTMPILCSTIKDLYPALLGSSQVSIRIANGVIGVDGLAKE